MTSKTKLTPFMGCIIGVCVCIAFTVLLSLAVDLFLTYTVIDLLTSMGAEQLPEVAQDDYILFEVSTDSCGGE